jgi:cell division protein ZapA
MSSKNNTEVIIDGKIYTLSGYESEEYLQKVASYINNKLTEFKKDEAFRRQTLEVQRTLLNLNIADDYFKVKKQADVLTSEVEVKEKQLYEIKHELIAVQIRMETQEKEANQLKDEIAELQKQIVRLETKLVEAKEREKEQTKEKKSTSKTKTPGQETFL